MIGIPLVIEGRCLAIEGRLSNWTGHVEILLSALNGALYVLVLLEMIEYALRVQMLSSSFVLSICIQELDNQNGLFNFI